MSNTPKTDSCTKSADRYGDRDVVPASICGEFEAENAKLREAVDSIMFLAASHPHLFTPQLAAAVMIIHPELAGPAGPQ